VKTYYSRISCKKLFSLERESFGAYNPKIGEILRKYLFFPKRDLLCEWKAGLKITSCDFYRKM